MKTTMQYPNGANPIEQAQEVYGVNYWSGGYFSIDNNGLAVVNAPDGSQISLNALVEAAKQQALPLPVLFRFQSILHDRIEQLSGAFCHAMDQEAYQADYTIAYPIKVNQQFRVVDEISGYSPKDQRASVGLEAGSKPELMAVLAMMPESGGMVVCNGYKDREFIRLALLGEQMGHQVYIVVEKLSEINLILEESQKLNVKPRLGVRVRLSTIGKA